LGVYKICGHRGRARDRCEHAWWGSFRGKRVSLTKWTNRTIDSKTAAQTALEDLRKAIREGTFNPSGLHPETVADSRPAVEVLTFRRFAGTYAKRHVHAKRLKLASTIKYRLKPLVEHFGDRPLAEIRTADVEDFIAKLKEPRPDGRALAPASINRTITLLRHMFNWAVGREYLDRTPFRRGTEVLIRLEKEDNRRRRRVTEDEEARLLGVARPQLRSMIITALDTGMRRGEMLSLRFGDIDRTRQVIRLRGETTKSGKTKLVPIGTARLRAVFDWLQIDNAGERRRDDALVFSDETGQPPTSFRRAWVTTVLKAHGVKPTWAKGMKPAGKKKGGWKELTAECHAEFRRIDLHWHDFRHEYASRLVERGVPLAQVRDLLGHASIATTERYDNQTLEALQAAAGRLESGKVFDTTTAAGDSGSKFQDSFKIDPQQPCSDEPKASDGTSVSACETEDLGDWLGGRDLNPDNVVQSHVSYR
jgi:site-specific recombinase XerD